jgi:hypothetical protein
VLGLGKPVFDLHWTNRKTLYMIAVEREQAARLLASTEISNRLLGARGETTAGVEALLGLSHGRLAPVSSAGTHALVIEGRELGQSPGQVIDDLLPGEWIVPIDRRLPQAASGWQVQLNFRDGRFASGTATAPPAIPPLALGVRRIFDVVTHVAVAGGIVAWLGGMLAVAVERQWRSRFAEFALAGALIASVGWAVQSGEPWSVVRRVGLCAGLIAIFAAWRTLQRLRRFERSREHHFCFECGYNLNGNVTGMCPECGAGTYEAQLEEHTRRTTRAGEAITQLFNDDDQEAAKASIHL